MTKVELRNAIANFQRDVLDKASATYNSLAVEKKAEEAKVKLYELWQLIPNKA